MSKFITGQRDQYQAKGYLHALALRRGIRALYPDKVAIQPDGVIEVDDSDAVAWAAGQDVQAADIRTRNGKSYICIQPHRTQSDWPPEVTINLWTELRNITADNPDPWIQKFAPPYYRLGDFVTHNGKVWECTAGDASGNNVWQPGVYGWTEQ